MTSRTLRALPLALSCLLVVGCTKTEESDPPPAVDTHDPAVLSVTPEDGATNISTGSTFTVTFTDSMDPATLVPTSFYMVDTFGDTVDATIAYDPATNSATLTPTGQLLVGMNYELVVTPDVRDPSGNALNETFVAFFSPSVDDVAPRVLDAWPFAGSTQAPSATVGVQFDEALVTTSASGAWLDVEDGAGAPVAGTFNFNAAAGWISFTPSAPWTVGTTYTASLDILAADASGNYQRIAQTWSFTVAMPAITGAPVIPATAAQGLPVTVRVPINGATDAVEIWLGKDVAAGGASQYYGSFFRASPTATEIEAVITVPLAMALGPTAVWVSPIDEAGTYAGDLFYRWNTTFSSTHYAYSSNGGGSWTTSTIPLAKTDVVVDTTPAGSDLVVSVDTVVAGAAGTLNATYTVTNNGGTATAPFALGLYSNATVAPLLYWVPDVWVDISALAPGATSTATVPVPDPVTGPPIVGAFVDVVADVTETDEGNNADRDRRPETATAGYATPVAIPDLATVNAVLAVTGAPTSIRDITVTVNLNHTFDGDLIVSILSPAGTQVVLSNRRGGGGDNMINTVFDTFLGPTAIAGGAAPFTGTYRPDASLAALAGQDANGNWTLRIQDAAGADVGTLNSFTLKFW